MGLPARVSTLYGYRWPGRPICQGHVNTALSLRMLSPWPPSRSQSPRTGSLEGEVPLERRGYDGISCPFGEQPYLQTKILLAFHQDGSVLRDRVLLLGPWVSQQTLRTGQEVTGAGQQLQCPCPRSCLGGSRHCFLFLVRSVIETEGPHGDYVVL